MLSKSSPLLSVTMILAFASAASSTTWLFVRMKPELSIMKPEPELPASVVIETTDGRTRFAKPATESGLRSIEFEAETKLALPPKNPPEALTPRAPPIIPAMIAKMTTAPGVTPLLDRGKSCEFHHGASECALVLRVRNFMALILLQLCCD